MVKAAFKLSYRRHQTTNVTAFMRTYEVIGQSMRGFPGVILNEIMQKLLIVHE